MTKDSYTQFSVVLSEMNDKPQGNIEGLQHIFVERSGSVRIESISALL